MNLLKKITACILAGGMMATFCGNANAAIESAPEAKAVSRGKNSGKVKEKAPVQTSPEASILFRIENIEPIKNKDGLVDKCRFLVTVYNRMEEEVKEASLVLNWKDSVTDKYKIVGDKIEVIKEEKANKEDLKKLYQYGESSAATAAPVYSLSKNIELKSILPHKQKSFEESIETEKCFLLFDKLEYKVNSCIASGDDVKMKDNKLQGTGTCAGKFSYINSQNPEYYSEFKDVPDSVLEEQVEDEKNRGIDEVNKGYDEVTAALKKLSETLDKMK